MKPTSLVLAALAAGAAALSQATDAQTIARSIPLATVPNGTGGFSAHFGDSFAAATAGSSFSDVFTFTASSPFDAAASLTSVYLDNAQTADLAIIGLSLYRYDPSTMAILGNAVAGIDQTGFGQHPVDAWSLTAFGLPGGAYALKVDGRVSGVGGGVFGADLAVAPVPEAPAWGMLVAGLGLASACAWRGRFSVRGGTGGSVRCGPTGGGLPTAGSSRPA